MSVARGSLLANENWSSVLAHLSLHDLTVASRVSKSWHALTFRHLYHTVCLTLPQHLRELVERVTSGGNDSSLLQTYIKGLILDECKEKLRADDTGKSLGEDDLDHLLVLLPRLPLLQHFTWCLDFFPSNQLISLLQNGIPNLKSVDWWNGGLSDVLGDEEFLSLLKFKDLTHFTLQLEYTQSHDLAFKDLDPIASCLIASPNLESLILDFDDWAGSGATWSPEILIDSLGGFTFPSLRVFRAMGRSDFEWSGLLNRPSTSSPLGDFLSRHPNLHTTGFGWVEGRYCDCNNSEDLASLLPSLKHLEAPAMVCEPILASNIAKQLESVVVADKYYDRQEGMVRNVAPLPNLRRISFLTECNIPLEVAPLKALLKAAPNLEEFNSLACLSEPDQILEVLKLTPNLREFRLASRMLSGLQTDLGISGWKECIPALVETCPSLRRIQSFNLMTGEDHFMTRSGVGEAVGWSESIKTYR